MDAVMFLRERTPATCAQDCGGLFSGSRVARREEAPMDVTANKVRSRPGRDELIRLEKERLRSTNRRCHRLGDDFVGPTAPTWSVEGRDLRTNSSRIRWNPAENSSNKIEQPRRSRATQIAIRVRACSDFPRFLGRRITSVAAAISEPNLRFRTPKTASDDNSTILWMSRQ